MPQLVRHRRIAAWIALIAMVLVTLAPAVSRAMAVVQGEVAPWSVVCSVGNANPGGDRSGDPAAHLQPHCALCAAHLGALGVPPAEQTVVLATALRHAMPLAYWHAARTLPVWAAAQARAPPSFI